jgi:hypothetical protein
MIDSNLEFYDKFRVLETYTPLNNDEKLYMNMTESNHDPNLKLPTMNNLIRNQLWQIMEMDRRKNDHSRLDWTYQRLKAIVKKDQYV